MVIRRKGEGVIQFDGESARMGDTLSVSVLHNALGVMVPVHTSVISQLFDMMPQHMREMLPPQFWADLFHQFKELSPQQLGDMVPQQIKDIVPKFKKIKNEVEK